MTEPLPPGVTMTEISDPGFGALTGPAARSTRSTPTPRRASAWSWSCWTRTSRSRARRPASPPGRTFKTGAALIDASTLGADRPRGDRQAAADAGHRPADLPGRALRADQAEDRHLHRGGQPAGEPDPDRPGRRRATAPAASARRCSAHAEDADPGVADHPDHDDRPRRRPLVTEQFTAFINPVVDRSRTPTGTAPLDALRAFVNAGGRYIGTSTNGTTIARNAGLTLANTQAIAGINTPGSMYDAMFDTTSPLSWGYRRRRLDLPRPRRQRQSTTGHAGRQRHHDPGADGGRAIRRRLRPAARCTSSGSTSTPAVPASCRAARPCSTSRSAPAARC